MKPRKRPFEIAGITVVSLVMAVSFLGYKLNCNKRATKANSSKAQEMFKGIRGTVLFSFILLLLPFIILAYPYKAAFAQDPKQASGSSGISDGSQEISLTELIDQAVENALREKEVEKAKRHAQFITALKSNFKEAVRDWIAGAKQGKEAELNKLSHQEWQIGNKITFPVPYDYYLRGYDYQVINADCYNTGSVITPYRASISLIEKLFLESQHSSDASDVGQYYRTATRPIAVSLEYRDDKFTVTNTEYGEVDLELGWLK